jgi:hypothetical protein
MFSFFIYHGVEQGVTKQAAVVREWMEISRQPPVTWTQEQTC